MILRGFLKANQIPFLCRSHMFLFSNQGSRQTGDRTEQEKNERSERLKQLQFRKRMAEADQIRKMNVTIETTRSKFSPITQYIMLFRSQMLIAAFFICVGTFGAIIFAITGVHVDPFTKKKKFALIGDKYQRSLNQNLRITFLSQFGSAETVSSKLKQQCLSLESSISSKANRKYKIALVQSDSQIIVFLPETVILSKNLLLGRGKLEDLQKVVLLMEALFAKKKHIKNLAFSNIFSYMKHKVRPGNFSDLTMLKIYTTSYNASEIDEAISQITEAYAISADQLKLSLSKVLTQANSSKQSIFSLRTRLAVNEVLAS